MVLQAWQELQRIQRERQQLQELPLAQISAILCNINRDPKKTKPFELRDFALFAVKDTEDANAFSAEVAAVALQLRHEGKAPNLLIAVWPKVLACSKNSTKTPASRAFHSDDDAVWVLAPKWEGANCRGGLVLVQGRVSGPVLVRDVDKPLITHCFEVPERPGFGWIEAGHLLIPAETSGHGRTNAAHRAGEPASG